MEKACVWNRTSETLLLELVREKRFLWDPKDSVYHKTKLRQEAFKSIAEALTLQCPELSQLNGDQVRLKFKNLRTYFLNQHRKIRDAPSGSAGCPGVKWPLYDAASVLLDAQVDQTPSKSTFVLSYTMGEDSDLALVEEVLEKDALGVGSFLKSNSPVQHPHLLHMGTSFCHPQSPANTTTFHK